MMMSRPTTGLIIGAGFVLLAASPAFAQDVAETYKMYQAGIYAHELCSGTKLDQDEFNKLGEVLDKKVNYELGAGERLSLIQGMKGDTKKLVKRAGCDSKDVQALLLLYDELAR
jgi:hypothetical protein